MGALKWQAAELASRLEMMQAQLGKAGLAAERAEEDKAKLEGELATALAAASTPPDQTVRLSSATCTSSLILTRCCRTHCHRMRRDATPSLLLIPLPRALDEVRRVAHHDRLGC